MKVKWDFVTNSSSTSYILRSTVVGKFPVIKTSYLEFEKFYTGFIYPNVTHFKESKIEEDYNGNPSYAFECSFRNAVDWNAENITDPNEYPVTIFNFVLDNHNAYDYPQLELVKTILKRIFFKELKVNISDQLMYTAHARKIEGDGWDGGDPMGPSQYEWSYDLHQNETQMGILSMVNNDIITDIHTIKQPLSFNKMVLDNINNSGIKIKEQNDKNS